MPKARPLLIVDIDGVLNPYGEPCPEGYTEHRLFAEHDEPVRVCERHAAWLRALGEAYDLVWYTAWTGADRALLGTVLDLPPFAGAVEMPPAPFDPGRKVSAIDRAAAGRPLAWVDDLLGPQAWDWARSRPAPTLLVPVDPVIGLAGPHVTRLLAWARGPASDLPTP